MLNLFLDLTQILLSRDWLKNVRLRVGSGVNCLVFRFPMTVCIDNQIFEFLATLGIFSNVLEFSGIDDLRDGIIITCDLRKFIGFEKSLVPLHLNSLFNLVVDGPSVGGSKRTLHS